MKHKAHSPISNELELMSYGAGIKLVKPSAHSVDTPGHFTVNYAKQLPLSFYILDLDGNTLTINEEGSAVCGFDSEQEALGKSLLDVSKKESAIQLLQNCNLVANSQTSLLFDEVNLRKDNVTQQFLTVKTPWYNEENKIIGVLGCSVVIGQHALAYSLSEIKKIGMLRSQDPIIIDPVAAKIQQFSQQFHLTQREKDCLYLTVKGYTAKRIAKQLNISFRTVEEYITNIRIKLNAPSKAALIEMILALP